MKITVTAEDIANGRPKDADRCPIALAVCRALNVDPESSYIQAEYDAIGEWVRVDPEDEYCDSDAKLGWTAVTPDAAYDFMTAFDGGDSVEPFEFDLDVAS